MTAGPYAAATGLIERFAGAFAHAVPADPRDDGFFGPASLTWQVNADLSAPVAGLRALLLQALHPLVMAGVDQHSSWQLDPAGRLAATSGHARQRMATRAGGSGIVWFCQCGLDVVAKRGRGRHTLRSPCSRARMTA